MSKVDANKLKGLSREEKLKLYDLAQQKKRLAKTNRMKFKPHEGQLPVMKSNAYIRLLTAGNGFGKSSLGSNEALYAVNGYNPIKDVYTKSPSIGVVVLDNPLKVKEVWLKELDKWCLMSEVEQIKNGKPYVNELCFKNGSRIIFMFHEQEEMVFESLEVDWIIYDEPPPRHIFVALSRGQRTKGSKPWQLIIGTPLAAAWLRQEIFEPWERGERPDVECFRGHTNQNVQNLSDGYIEQFSRLLSEEEKKIRLEGQWFDLGGLALKHLIQPAKHYVPRFAWGADDPVVIALDPHPSKAHVAIALGKRTSDGQLFAIGELSSKATARDFAMQLHDFTREWKVVDWVCDSLGSADTTGGEGFKSFIQVLKDCGIPARATSFEEKSDEAWIDRIRSVLDVPIKPDNFGECWPLLRIFDSCYNLKKDIENVSWLKYRGLDIHKPKLDITQKDFLACLKYALASQAFMGGSVQSRTIRLDGQKHSWASGQARSQQSGIRARYFGGNKGYKR